MVKQEQREPYLFLANFPHTGYGLCNECHYGEFSGYSCCDGELACTHPLSVINGEDDDGRHMTAVWADGADCWGFRPRHSLQEIGVIASIRASGKLPVKKNGEWCAAPVPEF